MATRWFDQWRAAYDLEPWGEERTDRAMGQLVMHLVACHGVKPEEAAEYMPYLRRPKPPPEPMAEEDIVAVFSALAKAMGTELVTT